MHTSHYSLLRDEPQKNEKTEIHVDYGQSKTRFTDDYYLIFGGVFYPYNLTSISTKNVCTLFPIFFVLFCFLFFFFCFFFLFFFHQLQDLAAGLLANSGSPLYLTTLQ